MRQSPKEVFTVPIAASHQWSCNIALPLPTFVISVELLNPYLGKGKMLSLLFSPFLIFFTDASRVMEGKQKMLFNEFPLE